MKLVTGGAGLGISLVVAICLTACGGPAQTGQSAPRPDSTSRFNNALPSTDSQGPDAMASHPSPRSSVPRNAAPRTRPPDPLAPKTIRPIMRQGGRPHPSETAKPVALAEKVRYRDGLTLSIERINMAEVGIRGPGAFPGQAMTTFTFRLTNGTNEPLRMNHVVVIAIYGKPERIARPVYNSQSQDFAGTVQPAGDTNGAYAFAIPKKALDHVVLRVDFDGHHAAAVFKGSAPKAIAMLRGSDA